MQPLLFLVVIPVIVGIAAELAFRDARNASAAATIGTLVVVAVPVYLLGSDAAWGWFAALLVSPLPIACSVATALLVYGRVQERHRHKRR